MDIYNTQEELEDNINKLKKCIESFGDINLGMIEMINNAKISLEGRRMLITEQETIDSYNQIKKIVENLEGYIKYLETLLEELDIYFSCQFVEVQ